MYGIKIFRSVHTTDIPNGFSTTRMILRKIRKVIYQAVNCDPYVVLILM